MLASFVPQMMHMTLPTVAPGVSCVMALLVARTLVRARCGRRRRRLGSLRATRRWHDAAPGGPRAACGAPRPVFGFGDARPVVWRMNDAARQALTTRAMLVLAGRGSGSVRDRPAARVNRCEPSSSG